MELVKFLTDSNVITFFLLFARFSAIFAFFPFFSYQTIPMQIKTALILYITILFFPLVPEYVFGEITPVTLMIAVLAEIMLGFIASIFLSITFHLLHYAGEQISFIMGFSMASVMDPASGNSTTVMSQLLVLIGMLIFLSFDGHHLIILFVNESIGQIPLGSIVFHENIITYIIKAIGNFFVLGFSIAFPVVAIGLLSDLIFGMLMKTMPQFNLLVVGLPIKVGLSLMVLFFTIGSMMVIFKQEFVKAYNALVIFFTI